MQIDIVSENVQQDEATELFVQTNAKDLLFLGFILETFEGYCNFTTIDKKKMLIKITISKDFRQEIMKILSYLRKYK